MCGPSIFGRTLCGAGTGASSIFVSPVHVAFLSFFSKPLLMDLAATNGTSRTSFNMQQQKAEALAVMNGHFEQEPTLEQLEMELPTVLDGQVPLGELLSRVVQAIYAELSELAET
jgi:hypothetical protein